MKRKISKSHRHDDVEVDIILFLSSLVTFWKTYQLIEKKLNIKRKKKEK